MRSILILLFLVCLITPVLFAGEVTLEEIFNPSSIKVGDQYIYIVQEANIFIYSAKDFKLFKKFGRVGEGPQEFKKPIAPWLPIITIYTIPDKILVNSIGKISYYTKKGEFIKEQRTPAVGVFGRYIPCGKNLILMRIQGEPGKTFVPALLVDSKLETIKEVCRVTFPAQAGKATNILQTAKMADLFDRYSYRDKFVIPIDDAIKIFDQTGKELKSFAPGYTKVKITSQLEKKYDEFFSVHKYFKGPYLRDKNRNMIAFGDYLPVFNFYRLADDRIYIFSNFKKDGKYETFIYDFDGKLVKKTFLYLEDLDILNVCPFDIKNNKIHQLVYNEDEEKMELIITKI